MGSRPFRLLSSTFAFACGLWVTSVDRVVPDVAMAQAPSAQGKIAFTSNRDGNDEIYVMNADGTGVTRLTNDPASDRQPAWSPDGSRIAFASNRGGGFDIYVMNADGTGVRRLTTTTTNAGSTRPSWCGHRIAFESDAYLEPFPDIFAMNEDGTGITRLTIDNAAFDRQPSWSPACNRLAFTKDPMGNVEIYTMNADGTGATRITNSLGSDRDPAWSPDGTRIAFASTRDDMMLFHEIYVINANGTGVVRLTDSSGSNSRPAWSPDGNRLAFVSNRDGDDEIYVMQRGRKWRDAAHHQWFFRSRRRMVGNAANRNWCVAERAGGFHRVQRSALERIGRKLGLAATRELQGSRHLRGTHGTVFAAERAADDLHSRHGER